MGMVVMACFRPKKGKADELNQLFEHNLKLLRAKGLVTERELVTLEAADGTLIELFEWQSEDAMKRAEKDDEVQLLWQRFGSVSQFMPIAALPEAQQAFSAFNVRD